MNDMEPMDAEGDEVHVKAPRVQLKHPTKREVEEHNRTHLPFRSWCRYCVRGKGINFQHRSPVEPRWVRKARLAMDYFFLGAGGDPVKAAQAEARGMTPTLCMVDEDSGGIWALPVEKKGVGHEGADREVERMRDVLDALGYRAVTLKFDAEPALTAVAEMLKATWRNGGIELQPVPVGEKKMNGRVERAVLAVEGQVRTLKGALEGRL